MKHLFVPYEIAILAYDKGYNERDFAFYKLSLEEENEPFEKTQLSYFHDYNDNHNFRKENNRLGYMIICTAPLYQQIIKWLNDKGKVNHLNILIAFTGMENIKELNKIIIDSLNLLPDDINFKR